MSAELTDMLRALAALTPAEIERLTAVMKAAGRGDSLSVPLSADTELMTAAEVATLLGVSVRYVYRNAHTWPFTRRISRKCLRFDRSELRRYVASRKGL
ncbi:MAG: helix-turn-helix domain-containing protein [Candidatus Eisenbacteria bacterium]|nr:helix-turn-helix domain-containing protein [Candidatus Eisenbacteria bacterium]